MKMTHILLSLFLFTFFITSNCSDHNQTLITKCLGESEIVSLIQKSLIDLYHGEVDSNNFYDNLSKFSLTSDFQNFKQCYSQNKQKNFEADSILTKLGETILYATNCEKDIGPALILLDMAISNLKDIKHDWKNFLINSISLGFVGIQSMKDCRSAYESIKNIWSGNKFLN